MGCDIHGVVERRWKGKWIAARTLDNVQTTDVKYGRAVASALERNYERFAALAGVRGDGPEARGLPDDASDTSRMLFETKGDHTPSWPPLVDAARIFKDTEGTSLKHWSDMPAYYYFGIDQEPLDEYRLVFWFDS